MTTEYIKQIERVRYAIEQHYEGDPFKDFCSTSDLIDVCNTLFVILDSRIANWRTEINFREDGTIEE